jgi:Transposase IS116/IS110/IS902 family
LQSETERERCKFAGIGLLLERGITLRKGRCHVDAALPGILEDASAKLSGALRLLLAQLKLELDHLQTRIDEADAVIKKTAGENEACQRLVAIPGIGPVTATAVIAAIGNGAAFRKGREFAAWMGLVPRRESAHFTILPPNGIQKPAKGEPGRAYSIEHEEREACDSHHAGGDNAQVQDGWTCGSCLPPPSSARKTRLGAHGVRFAALLRIADCLKWPIRRVRRPRKAPGNRRTLPHVAPGGAKTWFASTTAHFCAILQHFQSFSTGFGNCTRIVF